MRTNIVLLGVIAFVLGGCYEDKGNYDYKEVNDLESITFIPEPTITEYSYNYKYRQPALDTLRVTYSPTVTQSHVTDESNLEYQWIMSKTVNKETVLDTLHVKDLALKFPPKEKTTYTPLFRVIDHSTGVEYYRQFNMKTEVPFMSSLFVLHGQPGDRKLGVIEGVNADADEPQITYDIYENLWGLRRFQGANRLLYTNMDGSNYSTRAVEHITVIEPDSCIYMHAYDLVSTKGFELMMPRVEPRPRLAYGVNDEKNGWALLVDEAGHFYWSKGDCWFYTIKVNDDTKDYVVDKIFFVESNYAVIWDKQHKQFMYYNMAQNPWTSNATNVRKEVEAKAVLNLFEDGVFEDGEWDDQDVLYLGQGNSDISKRGSVVIASDSEKKYTVYQIGYSGSGSSFIQVKKTPATKMKLDPDSQFATSIAFLDQIFYTRKSAVYLYNVVSGEEIYLYDAGGPITKLQFRIARSYDVGYGAIDANRRLSVVVNNPDGTGEVHEIFLDAAGDIEKTRIHTGFGPIQDIIFSAPGIVH